MIDQAHYLQGVGMVCSLSWSWSYFLWQLCNDQRTTLHKQCKEMESAAKDQVVPVCENLGLELFRRKLCRDDFMTPEVVSAFVAPSSSVRLVATRRQYAAVVVGGNEVHLCKHTSASVDFLVCFACWPVLTDQIYI
jgi:hypothetical protein